MLVGEDTVVIALLGIDEKRTSTIWRTDAILLVFVNQEAQRISLLSLPRDLWVAIPGYGHNRINTVDALGQRARYPGRGPALFDQTLQHNLGVPVDHYVRVDFWGFVSVIDTMGGITVDIEKPLRGWFPDAAAPIGYSRVTLPTGPRHMDGLTALAYCRSRMTTSDFDRARRQQQVLMAILRQALTIETLVQAPKLWAQFKDSFDTDLGMLEAIQLAYIVHGIGLENARAKHLDASTVRSWTTPGGAQVLLPRTEAIHRTITELLSLEE
jgi:LCP family protein required for cell wall assembly